MDKEYTGMVPQPGDICNYWDKLVIIHKVDSTNDWVEVLKIKNPNMPSQVSGAPFYVRMSHLTLVKRSSNTGLVNSQQLVVLSSIQNNDIVLLNLEVIAKSQRKIGELFPVKNDMHVISSLLNRMKSDDCISVGIVIHTKSLERHYIVNDEARRYRMTETEITKVATVVWHAGIIEECPIAFLTKVEQAMSDQSEVFIKLSLKSAKTLRVIVLSQVHIAEDELRAGIEEENQGKISTSEAVLRALDPIVTELNSIISKNNTNYTYADFY